MISLQFCHGCVFFMCCFFWRFHLCFLSVMFFLSVFSEAGRGFLGAGALSSVTVYTLRSGLHTLPNCFCTSSWAFSTELQHFSHNAAQPLPSSSMSKQSQVSSNARGIWVHSCAVIWILSHLFIQELSSILLYVSFIQVGGQTHQTHLRKAKVCELDVAHWGNQKAENKNSRVKFKL